MRKSSVCEGRNGLITAWSGPTYFVLVMCHYQDAQTFLLYLFRRIRREDISNLSQLFIRAQRQIRMAKKVDEDDR